MLPIQAPRGSLLISKIRHLSLTAVMVSFALTEAWAMQVHVCAREAQQAGREGGFQQERRHRLSPGAGFAMDGSREPGHPPNVSYFLHTERGQLLGPADGRFRDLKVLTECP